MEKTLYNNMYFIENDVRVELSPVTPIPPHTHDFIEFVYMLRGRSVHRVDGVEYPLSGGDLLIINYGETHSFDGDPAAQFYNILIKPAFLDDSMRECRDLFLLLKAPPYREFGDLVDARCRCIRFSPEEKNCFEYMLRLLEKELQSRALGYDLTTHTGVNFLLAMILRRMCASHTGVPEEFARVPEYVAAHYAETLHVTELAAMCHYNPSYFSRVFRKYTGITFSAYLKQVRIAAACRHIEDGRRLGDLYTRVGYTNKTNFYKHFRQVTGQTPLQYKKTVSSAGRSPN